MRPLPTLIRMLVAGAGLLLLVPGCSRATGAPVVETVLAIEVGEGFAFTPGQLQCAAGQPVRLRLANRLKAGGSDLAHNLAVLKPGTDAQAYGRAVINARPEDHYIPAEYQDRTVAVSGFAHAGETIELVFTAPAEPGEYPIVCTFPGHCLLGMTATLVIR
jgi:uncharacterized cupredoxin-like copper-binding protein